MVFKISSPTLPLANSRSAMTVGLSRAGSTIGVEPIAICLARAVAANVIKSIGYNTQTIIYSNTSHILLLFIKFIS